MSSPTSADGQLLYVFDFDWSLVEENSDTWVLDQLEANEVFRRLKGTGVFPAAITCHTYVHNSSDDPAPCCLSQACRGRS